MTDELLITTSTGGELDFMLMTLLPIKSDPTVAEFQLFQTGGPSPSEVFMISKRSIPTIDRNDLFDSRNHQLYYGLILWDLCLLQNKFTENNTAR